MARVTNKMLSNNYLRDMNTNLQNLQKIQQQLSTGKNFTKPSDDPFNVARSMQMNTAINVNTQYNKNITNAINWMDTTDAALGQLGNVFQTIREKLISAGNAAYGSDERQKIKDEINQKVGQISQILNTNFDGEYIFGGTRGASKPVYSKVELNIPSEVDKTNESGGDAVLSGAFTGTSILSYKVKVTGTAATGNVTSAEYSTDNGSTWVSATVSGDTIDIGTGLKINISAAATNKVDDIYSFSIIEDSKLCYSNSDGTEMEVGTQEYENIQSKRQTEISQGVLVKYNVSASEVIKYGTDEEDDMRNLLDRIVKHLNGMTEQKDSSGNILTDASGNILYVADQLEATEALTNRDLSNLDKAMSQILKTRSQVGSKQNRMDSAKDQNEENNTNMTEILSKTEDIDITKKTMEYATMQTVYLASLQTGAKVIQPTLMDYLT